MDSFNLDNIIVTCSSLGSLFFWNSDNYSLLAKYSIDNTSFTTVKCSPVSNIIATGSKNGVLRIYDTENIKYSSDREWNVQLINMYKEFRKSLTKPKENDDKMVNIDEKNENENKFEYLSEDEKSMNMNYKELFIVLRNKISDYPIEHVSFLKIKNDVNNRL